MVPMPRVLEKHEAGGTGAQDDQVARAAIAAILK